MAFRIPGQSKQLVTSPIELFNKLKKLERLSLQQGQSLEEYEKVKKEETDIAIEMPAGSGKTLVGGLIGEFNRLTNDWRVVYCCATRQLASQTHLLLEEYGINSVLLVGKTNEFPEMDYRMYSRSGAIAVTTYSHIFNINPKFKDSNLIIFDDAHATEYAINDFWKLEVNKYNSKHKEIFNSLYSIIKDVIPLHVQDKIDHGTYDPLMDGVDVLPQPLWLDKCDDIRSFLDQATHNTDLYYAWTKIRNNLQACQIYISHNKLVIRPTLPPNKYHAPFYTADERIYMSATLGPVGELEKVFGVPKIQRISKFSKGANKVSGRRLILFPEDHFDKKDIGAVLFETIKMQPRCLFLCTSGETVSALKGVLEKNLPEYRIFLSEDVEDSLEEFRSCEKGILLLSGRYEGIDLKDADCRLQIFYNLPVAIDISEQFLQTRLRANEILKNRLSTRLVQGLGRCTRGTKDYAAVLFLGNRVGEYIYKNSFRKSLPPEIDAEIEFGFEQINFIKDLESWKESLDIFFNQKEDWEAAEEYIKSITDIKQEEREDTEEKQLVEMCALHEINFLYNLWDKNLEKAHREAAKILENAGRDHSLKGYRAWWNYLIACVGKQQNDFEKVNKYLENALNASTNKIWIDKEMFNLKLSQEKSNFNVEVETQLDRIITKLLSFGDRDRRFESDWSKITQGLLNKEANIYESALKDFGEFLGFVSYKPDGQGTPDGVWNLLGFWAIFEAKTNIKDPETEISLDDIRQAGFHRNWVIQKHNLDESTDITVCILCTKKYIEEHSEHAADNLYLLDPQVISATAAVFGNILRETLQQLKFSNLDTAKEYLASELIKNNLTDNKIKDLLRTTELKSVVKR
ncbi:helicase C-terminal domain-containing protein [Priestia aryabhattai]